MGGEGCFFSEFSVASTLNPQGMSGHGSEESPLADTES